MFISHRNKWVSCTNELVVNHCCDVDSMIQNTNKWDTVNKKDVITLRAPADILVKSVETALEAGYRHFDSARAYEDEAALGKALNQWIGGDVNKRKELFVATKLPPGGNRPDLVEQYFEDSRQDLGLDYIDLYLLHTPFGFKHVPGDLHPKNPDGSMMVDHTTDLIAVWKNTTQTYLSRPLEERSSIRLQHSICSKLGPKLLCPCCCGGDDKMESCDMPYNRQTTSDSYETYSTLKTTPTPSLPIDPKQKCESDIVVSENPLITPNETIEKLLEETINKHKQTLCETKPPASLKKAVLKLKESGRVRHVGVSNVNEEQLIRLTAVEKPACLQVEVHVLFQQKSLIAAANRLGIPVVAYSPLGSRALTNMLAAKTGRNYPHLLELPLVLELSKKYSRTPAQILLRFLLQHGVGAIPKSTDPTRIKQNISLWDFELNDTEMQDLHNLDRGEEGRICDFGFFIGVQTHPEFPFKKN
ncbi:aldo-keto reductase [Danaus plexippus plexippus]|uniref:Aldo-keto reductase n=1 Tax=Danaus plexippus plexippus TaxID=278856 RepID=A0A212FJ96_DANPL|nr:aldo-keto reductase [Danaus plexippus plexippus]